MFTAEQITPGHPDKVCDQISDAILDAYIENDPLSRVAVETLATGNNIIVGGEITSQATAPVTKIVQDTLQKIGYVEPWYEFANCSVTNLLRSQSPDIAQGVAGSDGKKEDIGAGDQGIMFGYATSETEEMLPLVYVLANRLVTNLFQFTSNHNDFGPDGKVQITLNKNKEIDNVIISNQHAEHLALEQVRDLLKQQVIIPTLGNINVPMHINATGKFVLGGPAADAGLTGRKIVADNYGPGRAVGGGAFSGKDPTKVDRSAAYMCRYVAKHIVAAGKAKRCQVMVAYSIGRATPTDLYVDTFGTGDNEALTKSVRENFDFTPTGIIETLKLRQPIYLQTARLGHFTKPNLPWEIVDTNKCDRL